MSARPSSVLQSLRLAGIAAALVLIGALGYLEWRRGAVPVVVETGVADVGGAFDLIDHTGQAVTAATFLGRPIVVYFGWSHDPDLTPAALQVLRAALQDARLARTPLQPVFITVDPARDTPARLASFAEMFDVRLVALTGSTNALAQVSRAYKHYAKRIADQALPGGYGFDHASLYYVMGADGRFRGIVPHTTDAAELATELLRLGH